ncbi:hypothetical protein QM012_006664 [Aureobasidium pullulans]|uniref:Uncharacterized protein n=1 Tax=Aureobasidium pullulans TaxID=5580 RepID=A0ABR0TP77_AURPU
MADNTPRSSLRDAIDLFIRRRFDEVSSERDTAVADNAAKQKEINALHDKISQLQRDLDQERQQIKDTTGISLEKANHQNKTTQHHAMTPATMNHHEVIIIIDQDYQNDSVAISEDFTAETERDAQVVPSDTLEAVQPVPKKRKKNTKPAIKETIASKRSRREPKPTVQEKVHVDQDADLDVPRFFVDHSDQIVTEDGETLPQEI